MKVGTGLLLVTGLTLTAAGYGSWASAGGDADGTAAGAGGRGAVRDLAFNSQRRGASTDGRAWRRVGERMLTAGCAGKGLITATVSMDVSGGPVDVRVIMSRTGGRRPVETAMDPGPVRFDPASGGRNSFAYTFGRRAREPINVVAVQWRAASGTGARLEMGSLQVLNGPIACD
jgi:hypothetical protein